MRSALHLGLTLAATALAAGLTLAACGSDSDTGTATGGGTPTCESTAKCTSVKSDCLAFIDNASTPKATLRFSQLTITGPKQLATGLVATTIAKAVLLDDVDCNLTGQGTFSWLMEFDKATGDLRTGGAPPAKPEDGYCFVNSTLGTTPVAPLETKGALQKDGSFKSPMPTDLVTVPIYLTAKGDSYVLLPLRNATIEGKLSSDFNCIGKYNASALNPADGCVGDADVPTFIDDGKLDGIITIEDSDKVLVEAANQSLCVLLSGDSTTYGDGGSPAHCKRDANMKITLEGDYCSTTKMPGGCKDAFQLSSNFSASAVKINGDCK